VQAATRGVCIVESQEVTPPQCQVDQDANSLVQGRAGAAHLGLSLAYLQPIGTFALKFNESIFGSDFVDISIRIGDHRSGKPE
jgi:hypothetical protein